MLLDQTLQKLRDLGCKEMAMAVIEQMDQVGIVAMSFEERLGLAVDREWDARENRRLGSRLKAARLKQPACIEDLDFAGERGLDRGLILTLASGHWIAAHQHIVIAGPTGAGKTFVACALGNRACRLGYTA